MAGKITIQTIAENCGVCIATVSRVLNGSSSVSESVRRKVLDYIEDTGWKSSRIRNRMFPVEEQIVRPFFLGQKKRKLREEAVRSSEKFGDDRLRM